MLELDDGALVDSSESPDRADLIERAIGKFERIEPDDVAFHTWLSAQGA